MPAHPNPPESGGLAGSKLILGFGFLLACALLLPFYRYELTPDSITYLSIAKQYTTGYFNEAISNYWSPLYSWLIAALLALHVPDILAAKLICIGAGVFALLALRELAELYPMSTASRLGMLGAGAVMLAANVFEITGPDLLFAAVLLCYFQVILDLRFPARPFAGLYCGLLGGIAYLAKGYGLFFFGAHFALFCTLHWFTVQNREARLRIVRHFLSGLTVFALIVLAWMIPLHAKYGTWTTGSTGKFNYRLVGPESSGYPHLWELEAPSSEHAANAWQEPPASRLKDWNVFASAFTLRHEGKLIFRDSVTAVRYWVHAAPLLAALILVCWLLVKRKRDRREWLFPLLTIALFTSGYLMITLEQRYLWLTGLLLLWMTFYGLDRCLQDRPAGHLRVAIVCLVALSFAVEPARVLRSHFRQDRSLFEAAGQLRPLIRPGSRLASCNDWAGSAYLAYRLDARYFGTPWPTAEAYEAARGLNPDYAGQPPATQNWPELNGKLEAAGIQYFLAWPGCTQPPAKSSITAASGPQLLSVPVQREQVQK
ncbi:MAG TPA: hypothetical protein VK604_24670 [Bryobacteraceae bacterium]|nr:hypothetical protein [Bryobacteraceae bacterium]